MEYKNPWESLTVRTYYQAVSYASVLQSRTEREDAVLPEDTVEIICFLSITINSFYYD